MTNLSHPDAETTRAELGEKLVGGEERTIGSENASLVDALLLSQLPGIGPLTLARLLERFETAGEVLTASEEQLRQVPQVGPKLIRTIRHARDHVAVDAIVQWCQREGVTILTWEHPDYPRRLHDLPDSPAVLFVRGTLLPCDELSVAIVGTRHATPYGRKHAEKIGYGLARAGVTVISGMARGIDTAAHRGALDGGGRTIAVFGCGLGHIYPPENEGLAHAIAADGALVSEFEPLASPHGGMFPQRNRIISGLAHATLVVEAPQRSGALITARTASEQGREVMALPGPVDGRASQGTNLLIRDGARLIRHVDDILECLGPLAQGVRGEDGREVRHPGEILLNDLERRVLDEIASGPTAIDQVIAATQMPTPQVLATLSVLEIRKLIRRLSNQYVSRI